MYKFYICRNFMRRISKKKKKKIVRSFESLSDSRCQTYLHISSSFLHLLYVPILHLVIGFICFLLFKLFFELQVGLVKCYINLCQSPI